MTKSNVREHLKAAIEIRDIETVGRCVDFYRYRMAKNYDSIYRIANELTGISAAEWDELLYCVDLAESTGD